MIKWINKLKRNHIILLIIIIIVVLLIFNYVNKNDTSSTEQEILPKIELTSNDEQSIYSALKTLSSYSEDFETIYNNRDLIPQNLLYSTIKNPEMTHFTLDYPTADRHTVGRITDEELEEKYPLLLQWDHRWGYLNYGNELHALEACGPTTLSMAIVSITRDKSVTPYEIAQYSSENGYYVETEGSAWALIPACSKEYGLKCEEVSLHEPDIKSALDDGNVLILIMGPGKFTSTGHFIMIYGYNETGYFVNDCNNISNSEKIWTFSEIKNEIRNIWAIKK